MHRIIALWAHPRSMSTALERVMRERGDLTCLHEPFMYYHYIGQGRRMFPGFDVQEDHPTSFAGIRDMLLERAEAGPVFFKDMAYYVVPEIIADVDFMRRVTHAFLVRHPLAAILSYYKLDPGLSCEEIGIEAQWQLFQALTATGQVPVVLDAEAVRADTRRVMARFWDAVGLDWREAAFDWAKAMMPPDWEQVGAWHEEISTSSGIRAADAEEMLRKQMEFDVLAEEAPQLRDFLEHHLPFYQKLTAVSVAP